MNNKIKISASMACADMLNLGRDIAELESSGVELLHIDVMDGSFVPNFCLSIDVANAIKKQTKVPLECHLMINDPERYVEDMVNAGASYISVHYESTKHIHRALSLINSFGIKAGVALNPATPLDVLNYIIDDIDLVTLMMIDPGFYGQKLIPDMIRKIVDVRAFLNNKNKEDIDILVDGNVSISNIPSMVKAGATILVGGTSSIFRKGYSIAESMKLIRTLY